MSMAAPPPLSLCVTKDSCVPRVFCHQEAITAEWGLLTVHVSSWARGPAVTGSALLSFLCVLHLQDLHTLHI